MDFILLEEYLEKNLSHGRLKHLYSTAKETQALLERYVPQSPSQEGYLAGLWHDAAREWAPKDLLNYSLENSLEAEEVELAYPHLLHGAVAAHLLAEMVGVEERILKAIRWHTLGNIEMGALGAALYIADYIEPRRRFVEPRERQELLESGSLEELCLRIIERHKIYLEKRERTLAETTVNLAQYLKEGGTLPYA